LAGWSRLILDAQHQTLPVDATQRRLNHVTEPENAGDITVEVLTTFLDCGVREAMTVER
jgi:hypothetical protein